MEGNAPSFPLPLEGGRSVTLQTVALPNLQILRLAPSVSPLGGGNVGALPSKESYKLGIKDGGKRSVVSTAVRVRTIRHSSNGGFAESSDLAFDPFGIPA